MTYYLLNLESYNSGKFKNKTGLDLKFNSKLYFFFFLTETGHVRVTNGPGQTDRGRPAVCPVHGEKNFQLTGGAYLSVDLNGEGVWERLGRPIRIRSDGRGSSPSARRGQERGRGLGEGRGQGAHRGWRRAAVRFHGGCGGPSRPP
jgi:hypothetical protein